MLSQSQLYIRTVPKSQPATFRNLPRPPSDTAVIPPCSPSAGELGLVHVPVGRMTRLQLGPSPLPPALPLGLR